MLEGAYAHIFGTLNDDIFVINELNNGKSLGILSLSVTHHRENSFIKLNNKIDFFHVFIWSEVILSNQYQSLKKGRKVYIYGELGTTEQTVTHYGVYCKTIIIEVNDRFKVEVLR
jgi:single-stranded DNA-binding protein